MKARSTSFVDILPLFALLALPAPAAWTWDKTAQTMTSDGAGLTPADVVLMAQETGSTWGRNIKGGQIQIMQHSVNQTVEEPVIDLTEPIADTTGVERTIESISAQAFNGNKNIVRLLLPDTVKFIGQQAFNNCTSLEDIRAIPAQIYEFGGGAFNGCTKLSVEVVLPEGFHGTTWNTFCNTLAYGDVVWPKSAGDVQILDFAYSKITSFTVPEEANCKVLHKQAFQGCTELKTVTLAEGVTTLGEGTADSDGNVFNGCTQLVPFAFPSSLTVVGYNTFQDTAAFTGEFVWPETVPVLPQNCFNGSALSSFVAKTGLKEIRAGVFKGCPNLKKVVLPDTLESMPNQSWAQSVEDLEVYWRACPKNALDGGLYQDWGSGRRRTHWLSATPENVAAWQAWEASDKVNQGNNWNEFHLPELFSTGKPDYKAEGTCGQEGGKLYWWKDPDLLPLPTILAVH